MDKDTMIYTCMEIHQSEIEKAIRDKNLKTIEDVQDETTAGTVCGGCVDDIYLMLEKINGKVEL